MSSIRVWLTFDPPDAFTKLTTELDDEVRDWLLHTTYEVGNVAHDNHPWQNRTGNLEAGTGGSGETQGRLSDGDVWGEVWGDTEYGEHLEDSERWKYIEPAWEQYEPTAERTFDEALQQAIDAAGWR